MIPDTLDQIQIVTDEKTGKWMNMDEILPALKAVAEKEGVPLDEVIAKAQKAVASGTQPSSTPGLSPSEEVWREQARRDLAARRAMESTVLGVDLATKMIELSRACGNAGLNAEKSMLVEKAKVVIALVQGSFEKPNGDKA